LPLAPILALWRAFGTLSLLLFQELALFYFNAFIKKEFTFLLWVSLKWLGD
jgi:hypothetical protein